MTLLATYDRAPVTMVAGDGCHLIDDRGRRYLDFLGGLAVCALGHAHPVIASAVADQATRLVHASNLYHHEPAGTLARELVERSGLHAAFFCNSGTEANEAAIKLARKWAFRNGDPHRTTILACTGSFHGRTLGSLAATANPAYREGFGPLPEGFSFTPFNDEAALDAAIGEHVAALIVEPVQCESGVHVASEAFLREAQRRCHERGALLVFDEVQCGMGRTGTLFAFQTFGVTPDVVTMAKALANGLPIGAVIVNERAAPAFRPGDHGSTFGGSPIPCAAALAHLRVRDALDIDPQVKRRSDQLFEGLRGLSHRFPGVVRTPRGLGLIAGLPVREPFSAAAAVSKARENGLIVGAAGGNTLRLSPPLIVTEDELRRGLGVLEDVLRSLQSESRHASNIEPNLPARTQA